MQIRNTDKRCYDKKRCSLLSFRAGFNYTLLMISSFLFILFYFLISTYYLHILIGKLTKTGVGGYFPMFSLIVNYYQWT